MRYFGKTPQSVTGAADKTGLEIACGVGYQDVSQTVRRVTAFFQPVNGYGLTNQTLALRED
jgi:hypothetical protein